MKTKKLLTGLLAMATLTATMGVPAFAETTAVHPNLTVYETDFTTVINSSSSAQYVDLMAIGADENWVTDFLSGEEAAAINWEVLGGSLSGITVDESYGIPMDEAADQYVAYASIKVDANAGNGIAVVEASNTAGAYVDFTISVNNDIAAVSSVSNVNNMFYDSTGGAERYIGQTVAASVDRNNHYGNSNYPSVLDAPMAVLTATESIVSRYNIISNYGTYTLQSFVLKELNESGELVDVAYEADLNDWSAPGWQYRVYDQSGNILPISEKVAADDFQLSDDCTIVWKWGTYSGTSFSDTL